MKRFFPSTAALSALLLVSACGLQGEADYPRAIDYGQQPGAPQSSVFGPGGLTLGGPARREQEEGGGIGVNAFLWRASLDTISFMPLASADPFGGVIITDWHSPGQSQDERFKVNLFILGKSLRADGVKVAVFRQVRQGGQWLDSPPDPQMSTEVENAVLTRARQLRMASQDQAQR